MYSIGFFRVLILEEYDRVSVISTMCTVLPLMDSLLNLMFVQVHIYQVNRAEGHGTCLCTFIVYLKTKVEV